MKIKYYQTDAFVREKKNLTEEPMIWHLHGDKLPSAGATGRLPCGPKQLQPYQSNAGGANAARCRWDIKWARRFYRAGNLLPSEQSNEFNTAAGNKKHGRFLETGELRKVVFILDWW